jgi:hypothetical protein
VLEALVELADGVVLPPLGDENDDRMLEACVAELRRGLAGR